MSTEQVKSTFDEIEGMFTGQRLELEMSGGEFTMRKDAVELIHYLRMKKIWWSSLVLDTMGVYLADESLARALGSLFDKANVSIHSCDAALHSMTAGDRTRFEDLETGLRNVFKFFPAVFTNTSLTSLNYNRITEIAEFILGARKSSPGKPLYCLFYIPVYREYGEANKENRFRLQGEDNAGFVPRAEALAILRAEFFRARTLLEAHGVPAILRDFNVPACLYDGITGSFPDSSFGLPNFTAASYFIDFAHPIAAGHSLDQVYPNTQGRSKVDACRECLVDEICVGLPLAWSQAGYRAIPIDDKRYAAAFPLQLLNQTLFTIFHDAVKARRVLSQVNIDWARLAVSFTAWLAGNEIRAARRRVAEMSVPERCQMLIRYLEASEISGAPRLADVLAEEMHPPASYA
jgi:hypothetical protein